jgi:DNA mismatch endonuclease (patch repair protein)
MADILTKAQRSLRMGLIRGHGNRSTELRLARLFAALNIVGWRRNAKIPGRPDFVFRNCRIAVFVDGCFWHGCPRHYTKPVSNADFWRRKRLENIARDRRVDGDLRKTGWRVMRIWEHELRSGGLPALTRRLRDRIPGKKNGEPSRVVRRRIETRKAKPGWRDQ